MRKEAVPGPVDAPRIKIPGHALPRRKFPREILPLASCTKLVQNSVQDLAASVLERVGARLRRGHEGFDEIPFCVRKIGRVRRTCPQRSHDGHASYPYHFPFRNALIARVVVGEFLGSTATSRSGSISRGAGGRGFRNSEVDRSSCARPRISGESSAHPGHAGQGVGRVGR